MTDDSRSITRTRFPRATVDVSIVLCTRNGERWIGDLLDSMARQTRTADELVVQDDVSTDATCRIIEDFAATAPFEVRLAVNPTRLGSTANFATALDRSRGRFVALADQDDLWYPNKLERLVGELELDPTITMVFSDADLIDATGRPLGRRLWDTRLVGRTLRKRAVVPEELFARRALTTGCTMAIRRRAVAASLPFPPELADDVAPMRHDRWLSLVAAAVGTVRALPEPLLGFRVHPDQETGVLVGAQLPRALGRAALGAVAGTIHEDERGHLVRAAQLDVAAARAEDLGDFEEAATLRTIAAHHRVRVQADTSVSERLRHVAEGVRSGAYGWDRLGAGAIAGDVVRAVRPHRQGGAVMLRKLRVLMVTDTLQVGGAEQVAVDIANTLDRDTHEVLFCATRSDGLLRGGLRDDVAVNILGRSATWDVVKIREFGRFVRDEGIDVIHSHGRGTMRFVALVRALGLTDAKHVFHDHFGRLHLDRSAGLSLRVPLQRGIDAYIGVESRLCRWAVETVGLPPERVYLVRSGVEVERFREAAPVDLRHEFDLGDPELVLVMVANFRPQKDHPTLFRALAELPDAERERLRVVICGSTTADPRYYAGCMAMLDRLGVAHLVTTIGVRDDAPALMAGADAGVFSSKNESGPLVLLEYMASQLPFVATETGEIAHAVRDDGVGILVEPRDYLALADALSALLGMSPDERTAMGQRGRRVVEDRFEQHVVVREVEHIYQRLLGTGGEDLACRTNGVTWHRPVGTGG